MDGLEDLLAAMKIHDKLSFESLNGAWLGYDIFLVFQISWFYWFFRISFAKKTKKIKKTKKDI